MSTLYTAEATATGEGRGGHARSSDGVLDLDLGIPAEMGGEGGSATNPEQLFAAGYAACFHSALGVVARQNRVSLRDSSVTAQVGIGKDGNGGYGLSVAIQVSLPGVDADQARQFAEQADQVCPYSNAVRGNVEIDLQVA